MGNKSKEAGRVRRVYYWVALGILTALSWLSLNYAAVPWAWIGVSGVILSISLLLADRRQNKFIWFNAAFFFVVLTLLEVYGYHRWSAERQVGYHWTPPRSSFFRPDGHLGYAMCENAQARVQCVFHDQIVHEAVYTTDEQGLRIAPPTPDPMSKECVLFMGCSITFGNGLNDQETAAYRLGMKTQGKYAIYNFGVGGYGAHQVYTQLDRGLVGRVIGSHRPRVVIYQAILGHGVRAMGRAPWDRNGPRYVLDVDGRLVHKGTFVHGEGFNRRKIWIAKKVSEAINRSFAVRQIRKDGLVANPDSLKLHVALVKSFRDTLQQSYPECEFHVVFWDRKRHPSQYCRSFVQQLRALSIPVHEIVDILPGFSENMTPYECAPPYETHPNALANELLAEYILDNILPQSEATTKPSL
jgi:hypothetical protein